ncbi:MAG: hypothetical protein IT328_27550 [Caldilineaceae bacterium]|nr:hypothetical protein [Caldilineaceae bacterium]
MDETSITAYITGTFDGVYPVDAWGDTFFFYNPGRRLPDEIYFATIKNKDDEYDRFSNVDRPSVFRLNIGISKATYRALFGAPPSRHGADNVADTRYDFTTLDQLLPHPVYGRMYWVCVLNPSAATFEAVQPLLAEAYDLAVSKYTKRAARA